MGWKFRSELGRTTRSSAAGAITSMLRRRGATRRAAAARVTGSGMHCSEQRRCARRRSPTGPDTPKRASAEGRSGAPYRRVLRVAFSATAAAPRPHPPGCPRPTRRPVRTASAQLSRPVASASQVRASASTVFGGVPRVCRGPGTHCTAPNGGTRTSTLRPGARLGQRGQALLDRGPQHGPLRRRPAVQPVLAPDVSPPAPRHAEEGGQGAGPRRVQLGQGQRGDAADHQGGAAGGAQRLRRHVRGGRADQQRDHPVRAAP